MLYYGENSTTFGVWTEILGYTAAPSTSYRIKSLIGWGDTPGEFELYVGGVLKAGMRTSDQKRTEQVWFGTTFICNENEEITVIGTHYSSGMRALKCTLELDRLS